MSNSLTKPVSSTFKIYLKFQPHLIPFAAMIVFRPAPPLTGVVTASWLASVLAYLVCSQHGSQCNLFTVEAPSPPGAPSDANWIPSRPFQPPSLSTLAFSTAAPWPFHDPFRPCCGLCASSSFFLEPASHLATGRPPSCRHTAILPSPSCTCTLSPLPPALRFSSPQHLLASETPIHVSLPEAVKLYGIQDVLYLTHCLISSTWTRTWHSVHIGGSGYLLNGWMLMVQ